MARRRRYQWIDAVDLDITTNTVAAGAVRNSDVVSEAELENLGGGMTLQRIVGRIVIVDGDATPSSFALALFMQPTYAGATLPTDWTVPDTYQSKNVLWSDVGRSEGLGANRLCVPRTYPMDWRSARKMSQGFKIVLAVDNAFLGIVRMGFHLRFLFQLP